MFSLQIFYEEVLCVVRPLKYSKEYDNEERKSGFLPL